MASPSLTRRAALAAFSAAILPRVAAAEAEAVRWSSGTGKPHAVAPPGATDCHLHTYDRRYQAIAGSTLLPEDALPDDYRALQRRLGTSRGVVIQPSTYGTDNSLQVASRQALGPDNFRVVAVVAEDVGDSELRRLDSQGVRGVRFNLTFPGVLKVASLKPLAPRLADLGWTCQINMSPKQVEDNADLLAGLPGRPVFDHYAHVPQPEAVESPAYKVVRRLLDRGNSWVKLSGPYVTSKEGPPDYADVGKVAAALVKAAPERLVWGSDWPHPTEKPDDKPDDARLFGLLAEWAGNAAAFKPFSSITRSSCTAFPRSRHELFRTTPPGRDHRLHPAAGRFRNPRRTAWVEANQGGRPIDCFLEGPSFDRQGRLYVTDIPHGRIFRVSAEGEWEQVAEYDGWPNGLKIHRDGRIFITDYKRGIMLLDPASGAVTPFLETVGSESFKGVNDLVFASSGNLYFTDQGQTGMHDPTGRVWKLTPEGRLTCLLNTIPSPNGIVVDPEESFLLVAVTRANQIWRVPMPESGLISKVGIFAHLHGGPGGPDGLALDSQGNLLICHTGFGSVWRLSPLAEPLDRIVSCAGVGTTNLAFGGPERRSLFITESRTGTLLRAELEVSGMPMFSHAD